MARILIVEDDQDTCEAIAKFFQKHGHECSCVPNGRDALDKAMNETPDLVVLDLYLPTMDGVSLLQILRSYLRLHALPVVVWTGVTQGHLVDSARRLKVNALLFKSQS